MANTLARMRQIVGLSADWAANNLTLGDGEIALERLSDGTVKARIGDGANAFENCPYLGGALDLTLADGRYVNEADTFTTGGPAAANKWPKLNAGGMLDPSLVNLPAALHYKGTADALGQPPAGAVAGDLYIVLYAGTVDASWGAPAAGMTCKPGDWLVKNNAGQWQLIPIVTTGTVTEAPTDGGYYARQNSAWANVNNGFVAKAGDTMTGKLGISVAPYASASSVLQTQGDISIFGGAPTLMFNGYFTSAWIIQAAGYTGGIKYDAVAGVMGFLTAKTNGAAGATSDVREVARFDKDGGFYVGSTGGDFAQTWTAVFRKDQNAQTAVGIINNSSGANTSSSLELTTGTGNSFRIHSVIDNAGAPYSGDSFGSAVQFHSWSLGGGERMRLTASGFLGIATQPWNGTSVLQTGGDISIVGAGDNPQCTLMFNTIYSGGFVARNVGFTGIVKLDASAGNLSFQLASASAAAGAASPIRDVAHFTPDGQFRVLNTITAQMAGGGGAALTSTGAGGNSGYLALFKNDGVTRVAYIGDIPPGGGDITYQNQTGGGHLFSNRVFMNGGDPGITGECLIHENGGTSIQSWTSTSAAYNAAAFNNMGAITGTISCTPTSTTYNSASDARLKENIADAADAGALIDAIRVRQFDWKATGDHVRFGTIAQELATHFPEAVTAMPAGAYREEGDDSEPAEEFFGVDYSTLVPLLIAELQALRRRVAVLEMPA
jgi:hypothetical protein